MHAMQVSKLSLVVLIALAAGCATVPLPKGNAGDTGADRMLHQCADAQGLAALMQLDGVHAEFEGKFSWIVSKVQPTLVDQAFRGTSREDYLVHEQVVTQTHFGSGGIKTVARTPGAVQVSYNGKPCDDPDAKDAAAMVADDYRMFLLGPVFFLERHAVVQYLGTGCADGFDCDQLLAVLKPGLGNSQEDRVVISIDQKQHWIRRVRITVEGTSTTRGAVADIFLRDPIRVGGVVFPTRFYEELKRPFDAAVHNWRLTAIDLTAKPSVVGTAEK